MDIARFIDHTYLKQDSTFAAIKQHCEEALLHKFAAVCVPPFFVKEAAHILENSRVNVATVAGFPLGYSNIFSKVEEIKKALDDGANEIDVVVNICAIKNDSWNYVRSEIESLSMACHMKGKTIKVIFETSLLTEAEIKRLCGVCVECQVDYVKTSTGFNGNVTNVDVVTFLRKTLPAKIKIKASGGIRDRQFAEALINAGATRIGTSASLDILKGQLVA